MLVDFVKDALRKFWGTHSHSNAELLHNDITDEEIERAWYNAAIKVYGERL